MSKMEFKAESKKLLDLMINSIYTHKEIFLRELISNANDAIDKLYFRSLTDQTVGLAREDFEIKLAVDRDARTLTISDNGIGMTREELENNLGTIAKSGSLDFKQQNELDDNVDVIGQFGVGFYSAFMVSERVVVETRAFGSEEAYRWESTGVDGYTIDPCEKDSFGTTITLWIKPNGEEEYDEFLDQYRIQGLVKKYSDYIRYPIRMEMSTSRVKEGTGVDGKDPEYETVSELRTLNSMIPIWRKQKSELTDDDYNRFYQEKFYDFQNPLKVIHTKTEGSATYSALLYIPAQVPYNYYSKDFEKGLQLYTSSVMIMEKCADLLPDYFSFVRGIVDSEDLSLNISRETLQHDRQLKLIAKSLEKKIKSELQKMLKTDRETYLKFYQNFGLQLKYGLYSDYGVHKEELKDLVLFYSSSEQKLVTLAEYVERMKEDQKAIYYASGDAVEKHIDHLPQVEMVKDKGYEILYLTDDIDEFALQMLQTYQEKPFQSVSSANLDLETEEEKKENQKQEEEYQPLFDAMKETLGDKVKAVRLSNKLKSHPVCLTNDGMISLEMEKVLNAMPNNQKVKAERVLEINASHPIFEKLKALKDQDSDKLAAYTNILYTQACMIEGLPVEDPVAYANEVCKLLLDETK